MTRRLVLAAGTLAAVSLLASCSTVDKPIATVNGVDIDRDSFEARTSDLTLAEFAQVAPSELGEDVLDGTAARQIATSLVQQEIVRQALVERNITVSAETRASQEDQLSQGLTTWSQATESTKGRLIDFLAGIDSLFQSVATPPEEAAALYEAGPAESGIVCVSHILVTTEAEAEAVEARLADGEDFATLAAEVSTDGSAAQGGVLTDPNTGSPCIDVAAFAASFVAPFVDGTLAAEVGVPTAPVQSDFGFHIIRLAPYDEVADVIAQTIDAAAQQQLVTDIFDAADVSVSSSIGTWSDEQRQIVALDQAAPAA